MFRLDGPRVGGDTEGSAAILFMPVQIWSSTLPNPASDDPSI
jgi:hypothetical protein